MPTTMSYGEDEDEYAEDDSDEYFEVVAKWNCDGYHCASLTLCAVKMMTSMS